MAQASTRKVSIIAILMQVEFTIGFNDKRWNSNFHKDYENWDKRQQWTYERGRLLVTVNPSLKIKIGKQLNPAAVEAYQKAKNDGTFI